ncbi:uncharacterized protein LOC120084146 [Benincasa hispida]|uniref:uncharacterized protein LOC120084146 n=1 Tax=Benincasa hispida TaxID=102211 RepID=UPI0019012010|nr:uncharacterized protein LOC120084146 [Benincasa hispida]
MLGVGGDPVTWEQFKERFYTKYFSANLRYNKEREFLELKQGHRSVKEYDQEYTRQQAIKAGMVERMRPVCSSCGRYHWGRCLAGTRVCFHCKQEGHSIDRCLARGTFGFGNQFIGCDQRSSGRPQHQQGRVYSTTWQEAEKAGTVVTGTLPILGHFALVLFDSGSSHSFISSMFVKHAMLELEPLHYVLSVSTPSGEIMLAKEKIKACQIEVASHTLDVTLVVLDMRDFDVILVMD